MQLIQHRLDVSGANKTNVPNWSGEDRVPKLQPEAERSNDVQLNGASSPRTAIDARSLRRCSLSVKPPAPNQVLPIAKRPQRIERIPCRNHHTVARAQVLLSDLLKSSRVVGNCFQRMDGLANHRQRPPQEKRRKHHPNAGGSCPEMQNGEPDSSSPFCLFRSPQARPQASLAVAHRKSGV